MIFPLNWFCRCFHGDGDFICGWKGKLSSPAKLKAISSTVYNRIYWLFIFFCITPLSGRMKWHLNFLVSNFVLSCSFLRPAHCSIEFSSRSPPIVSARSCGRRSFGRNLAAKKHKRWKERECDFCLFGLGRLPIKPLEQGHGEKWWDVPCVTVQMRVSGVPRSYSPLTFLISIPLASVITGLEAGAVVTPKKDTLWLFTIILFWTSSCSKKPPVEKFISTPISKWNWLEQKIVFWLYLWRPGECGSV